MQRLSRVSAWVLWVPTVPKHSYLGRLEALNCSLASLGANPRSPNHKFVDLLIEKFEIQSWWFQLFALALNNVLNVPIRCKMAAIPHLAGLWRPFFFPLLFFVHSSVELKSKNPNCEFTTCKGSNLGKKPRRWSDIQRIFIWVKCGSLLIRTEFYSKV